MPHKVGDAGFIKLYMTFYVSNWQNSFLGEFTTDNKSRGA